MPWQSRTGGRPGAAASARTATEQPGSVEQAREICLRQLTARARSRGELETALRRRGFDEDTTAEVLDRLAASGLVDDVEFAAAWAASRTRSRGLAPASVAAELRRRGVSADIAAGAVAGVTSDEQRHTAGQLVRRRLPALAGLPAPVQARRLVALLGRRGYAGALAHEVVRAELRAAGEADLPDVEG